FLEPRPKLGVETKMVRVIHLLITDFGNLQVQGYTLLRDFQGSHRVQHLSDFVSAKRAERYQQVRPGRQLRTPAMGLAQFADEDRHYGDRRKRCVFALAPGDVEIDVDIEKQN